MAGWHGIIESLLSADGLAVSVVELTVRAVNMDMPTCLDVLIALD
jgi:hypothetical protein